MWPHPWAPVLLLPPQHPGPGMAGVLTAHVEMTRLHGDLVHRRTLVSLAARVRGSAVPVRSCPRAGICVRPTRACPSSTHRATLSAMPGIRSRRVINRIVSYRYQQKDAHHGMFHRAASGPPFTISDEPNCSSAPWPGGSLAASPSAAIPNGRLMSTDDEWALLSKRQQRPTT